MRAKVEREEDERKVREEDERYNRMAQERIQEQHRLEFMIGWLKRSPMIHDTIMVRRVKEQQKKQAKAEKEREVLEAERKKQEEKKKEQDRAEWERQRVLHTCGCGVWKKAEFPRCWDCREKYLASLSDGQKKALLCACGKTKNPSFTKCYGCFKG
jgi:hypothetical protein